MHISFDCATRQHFACDGMRQVVWNSTQLAICECLCHGHAKPDEVRHAERLLTGQEA